MFICSLKLTLCIIFFNLSYLVLIKPVSYTHLDVYKRQKSISPFDRVLCFSWLGAGRPYPYNVLGLSLIHISCTFCGKEEMKMQEEVENRTLTLVVSCL